MDRGIRLQKEIAMGIASKAETNPTMKGGKKDAVKPMNKKCGGSVKKKK